MIFMTKTVTVIKGSEATQTGALDISKALDWICWAWLAFYTNLSLMAFQTSLHGAGWEVFARISC